MDNFYVYLLSTASAVGKLTNNTASHFTNDVKFPWDVVERSDALEWEVALVKTTSAAIYRRFHPSTVALRSAFMSSLTSATFYDADISQTDVIDSPAQLVLAIPKAVLDMLKLFPNVTLPKIKLFDGKLFWKSIQMKLVNRGN